MFIFLSDAQKSLTVQTVQLKGSHYVYITCSLIPNDRYIHNTYMSQYNEKNYCKSLDPLVYKLFVRLSIDDFDILTTVNKEFLLT